MDDNLSDAARALGRIFELEPVDERLAAGAHLTMEDVHAFLVERITFLLDHRPAVLMSILYRIDVAEQDVTRVLSEGSPGAIPGALADLIIERQLQKIRTRRRYG